MTKKIFVFIVLFLVVVIVGISYLTGLLDFFSYTILDRSHLILNLKPVNPLITSVSSEPLNKVVLTFHISSKDGKPLSNVDVRFSVTKGAGKILPEKIKVSTGKEYYLTYIPDTMPATPSVSLYESLETANQVQITAYVPYSEVGSLVTLDMVKPPVILVHGYMENGANMVTLKDYLEKKGLNVSIMEYDSTLGVEEAAGELQEYIENLKLEYLKSGVKVQRFDIISHSMGGIVTRFYTTSDDFHKLNNVRKIIFLSCPHRGSPWASLGVKYFNDQGVFDMQPSSPIYTELLPNMYNKGLNNQLQTANIYAEHDELVTPESVSLDEWEIETEIYNVGRNNLDVETIVSGQFNLDLNHKRILNNSKVFDRIFTMLNEDLAKPVKK